MEDRPAIDDFDTWAARHEAEAGGTLEELPCATEAEYPTAAWQHPTSRRFIFHTLFGQGMIERVKMWRAPPAPESERGQLKSDEVWGHTEIHILVQLGDRLCGHPEYIHGGFLSAIFDELFGWATAMEKDMLGEPAAKIFTANLDVNYRRPVSKCGTYLIKCRVNKVVRGKKIYLEGTFANARHEVLTESTSLYILTGLSSVVRNLEGATPRMTLSPG